MRQVDTILTAKWVVPIIPAQTVYHQYAIVIDQGEILALMPYSEVFEHYQSITHVDYPTHVISAGFVNAHTHLAMNVLRGLADDLPLDEWLNDYIWPAEQASLSDQMVYDGTAHAAVESVQTGVTCVNDHYFFPEAVARALKDVGLRGRLTHCWFAFALPWVSDPADYAAASQALLQKYHDSKERLQATLGPHAPYTVNDAIMQQVTDWSNAYQVPVHIHMHETAKEVADFKQQTGQSPVAYYGQKGWLHSRFMAVHMTQMDATDLSWLVKSGASVVHCPESNMKLASGMARVDALLKAGVNVALGTDGAASNNDLDFFGEMKSAAFLGKLQSGTEALPAYQVLEMATINGAKALGLADQIGSIEVGKQADLIAVDLSDVSTQPVYSPISQLVYAAGRHQVTDVWISGQPILRNRQMQTVSPDQVNQNIERWAGPLREKLLS